MFCVKWYTVIKLVFVIRNWNVSLAYIGEEMQPNKGPLLKHVESTPFVPDKNVLLPHAILSPDDVLKSPPVNVLNMPEDDIFRQFFNQENFVDITSDGKMKNALSSSVMALFLNASRGQLDNELQARVSFKKYIKILIAWLVS